MGKIILIDRDLVDADQMTRYLISRNEEISINRFEDESSLGNYLDDRAPSLGKQINLPSFIVIDVDFPNASTGLNIIRQFKSHNDFKDIPMFVFTKNNDKSIVAQCYVLGVSGYFLKPSNQFTFNTSLKQLMLRWNNLSQSGFGYNYRAV